jgi:hypothetical protein
MKKYIILLLCSFFYSTSFSQELPVDTTTKKITFSEVIPVAGANKDQLYSRAKNLNMLRENVKVDNKTEGTYSYKGQIKVTYPAPQVGMNHTGFVNYVVTMFVKDGKYKYTITDFVHTSDKGNGGTLEGKLPECNKYVLTVAGWNAIKKQTNDNMQILIKNIKINMNPVGDVPKNTGDW